MASDFRLFESLQSPLIFPQGTLSIIDNHSWKRTYFVSCSHLYFPLFICCLFFLQETLGFVLVKVVHPTLDQMGNRACLGYKVSLASRVLKGLEEIQALGVHLAQLGLQ